MRAALITAAVLALTVAVVPAAAAPAHFSRSADEPVGGSDLRDVMWVGNNWAGTATVVDARTFEVLATGVDLIPDRDEELARIAADPVALAFYLAIQQGPGEGNDQYVDDMFTTADGRHLAVSRPSFADVVWVDVARAIAGDPDAIAVEQPVDGFRTDHWGVSPAGRGLLVSDSTERQVIEFSMVDEVLPDGTEVAVGDRLRTFATGDTPHENTYSADGARIFHASIGTVYTPGDEERVGPLSLGPVHDEVKGDRWFQVVDAETFEVTERWDMGLELEEAGYPSMSSAVRPMALGHDERFVYYQVSFFHGFVEFDTRAADLDGAVGYETDGMPEPRTGAVTRVVPLPNRVPDVPREQYVNDSAHHGLSMDEAGDTLCVAGTMSDYAALVDVETMTATLFDETTTGHPYGKPYWTTEGLEGTDTCWISLSESDSVAVLDTETGEELAYLPVGDHPQRVRHGVVREDALPG
jgi:hypothetical protein